MSDTMDEATVPAADADPNFSVMATKITWNNKEFDAKVITWGEPMRKMTVRELNLGEQFDLVGVAGDNAGNAVWMAMAGLAASVIDVDGVPVPPAASNAVIKGNLNRIKPDGLTAYFRSMREPAADSLTTRDAAKNS